MIRRGIRRGIRRSFRRLTRGAVLSMAMVAGGVTLAEIARKEAVSEDEAEDMMDQLVEEGTLKKETRDGKTVYFAASAAASTTAPPQPAEAMRTHPATTEQTTKFCRQCGAKIASDSKFCEKCGARL